MASGRIQEADITEQVFREIEREREREREERGAGGMKQSDMTWRSRWRQTTWVRSDEVLDMP